MKFKNMKRFGSIIMSGVLALSLAVPAFATSNTTEITGTVQPITLRVVVPTTGAAIINPYGLPYTLGDSTISGQQITTTAPMVIQNRSSVALAVTANVSAKDVSTGVTLEAANAGTDYTTATDKKLHVVFEAFTADELTALNVTDNDTLRPMHAALDSADAVLTGDVTTTAADATGTLVLREAADGEVQSGGAAMFRLSGEVAKKASWTADDKFTATIAFTFEPGEYTKNAGTLALARTIGVGAADNTTADITFTSALPQGVTGTPVYSSSDPSKMTIVAATGSDPVKVKAVAAGSANLIVTIEGSDGLIYTSSLAVTVGNNAT